MSIPGATATAPAMMCLTEHEEMKTQGSTSWESIFIVLAILALVLASTCGDSKLLSDVWFWRLMTAMSCEPPSTEGPLATIERVELSLNNARLHKNFKELFRAGHERLGCRVSSPCRWIFDNMWRACPLADEIHIQDGSTVWHRDDHCDELYNSGRKIRSFQACAICAQQESIVPGDNATAFSMNMGCEL